jgi:hypothetical protein
MNLVKKKRDNLGNSQVVIKILNRLYVKIYVIFIEYCIKRDPFVRIKGNDSMKCVKTYKFKIKDRNVLMVYFEIYVLL